MPLSMERDYKEKDFQRDFGKWAKHNWSASTAFELKVSPTDSLAFSKVEDHQLTNLRACKDRKLFYKIADDSIGQKPFDCLMMEKTKAYIVVMFRCKERGQKGFFMFDIDCWEREMRSTKRKSMTEERAREIDFEFILGK